MPNKWDWPRTTLSSRSRSTPTSGVSFHRFQPYLLLGLDPSHSGKIPIGFLTIPRIPPVPRNPFLYTHSIFKVLRELFPPYPPESVSLLLRQRVFGPAPTRRNLSSEGSAPRKVPHPMFPPVNPLHPFRPEEQSGAFTITLWRARGAHVLQDHERLLVRHGHDHLPWIFHELVLTPMRHVDLRKTALMWMFDASTKGQDAQGALYAHSYCRVYYAVDMLLFSITWENKEPCKMIVRARRLYLEPAKWKLKKIMGKKLSIVLMFVDMLVKPSKGCFLSALHQTPSRLPLEQASKGIKLHEPLCPTSSLFSL